MPLSTVGAGGSLVATVASSVGAGVAVGSTTWVASAAVSGVVRLVVVSGIGVTGTAVADVTSA